MTDISSRANTPAIAGLEQFKFNNDAVRALTNTGSFGGKIITAIAGMLHLDYGQRQIEAKNNAIVQGFFSTIAENFGTDVANRATTDLISNNQGHIINIDSIKQNYQSLNNKMTQLMNNPMVKKFLPESEGFNNLASQKPIADNIAYVKNLLKQLISLPSDQLTEQNIKSRAEFAANITLLKSNPNVDLSNLTHFEIDRKTEVSDRFITNNTIFKSDGNAIYGAKIAPDSFKNYGEDLSLREANPNLSNFGYEMHINVKPNDAQNAFELLLPIMAAPDSPIGEWKIADGKLSMKPLSQDPNLADITPKMGKFINQCENILANAGIETKDPVAGEHFTKRGFVSLSQDGVEKTDIANTAFHDATSREIQLDGKVKNLNGKLAELQSKGGGDCFSISSRAGNQWVDYNYKNMIAEGDPIADNIIKGVRDEISLGNNISNNILFRDILGRAKVVLTDKENQSAISVNNGFLTIERSKVNDQKGALPSKTSYELSQSPSWQEVKDLFIAEAEQYGLDEDSVNAIANTCHQGCASFAMQEVVDKGFNTTSFQAHDPNTAFSINIICNKGADKKFNSANISMAGALNFKMMDGKDFEKLPLDYMDTEKKSSSISNEKLGNYGMISYTSSITFGADEKGKISGNSEISLEAAMVDVNARFNRLDFEKQA